VSIFMVSDLMSTESDEEWPSVEYVDLDVSIAADIVIQARQKERMTLPPSAAPLPAQPYGHPQQQSQQPPYPYAQQAPQPYAQSFQQPYQPPHAQPMSTYPASREPSYGGPSALSANGGGQNLQELLANLRQAPQNQVQHQHMLAANGGAPDLGALLSNVARQQNQTHGYPTQQYQQQSSSNNHYSQRAPLQAYNNPAGMASYAGGPGMGTAPHQGPAQNVQNIMDQLAKWKQWAFLGDGVPSRSGEWDDMESDTESRLWRPG
jgi:hypothetical protein